MRAMLEQYIHPTILRFWLGCPKWKTTAGNLVFGGGGGDGGDGGDDDVDACYDWRCIAFLSETIYERRGFLIQYRSNKFYCWKKK